MQRLPRLIARRADDSPDYFLEGAKALVLGMLVWMGTHYLESNGANEHRFTVLETNQATMKSDVQEIKEDVKTLIRRK